MGRDLPPFGLSLSRVECWRGSPIVAERVRGLVLTDKVQVKSPDKRAIIIRAGQVFGALNAATKFRLLQSACCCGGPHDFACIDHTKLRARFVPGNNLRNTNESHDDG